MKKLITFATCTLFTTAVMNTTAKDIEQSVQDKTAKVPTFTQIDSDGDGFISLEESKGLKGLLTKFGGLDADSDQRLSRAEFLKFKIKK